MLKDNLYQSLVPVGYSQEQEQIVGHSIIKLTHKENQSRISFFAQKLNF